MDPWRYLPQELRPPGNGDLTRLNWRANLGRGATVGEVGRHLVDLQEVIELGRRWGLLFAEDAAVHSLFQEIEQRGPRGVAAELSVQWNLPSDAFEAALEDEVYFSLFPFRARSGLPAWRRLRSGFLPPHPMLEDATALLEDVLTLNTYELYGRPPYAARIRFENPVDVAVSGAGFGFKGIISLLVLIRDWTTTRRLNAAEAAQAEARVDREQAEARLAMSRADLAQWYVNEVQQGRAQFVPAGQLANEAKDSELKAIDRLSETDPQLELPPGADGRGDN
jgi:hypothetical protein